MKEAEWLSGQNPDKMLQHLKRRASDRKLRLFSCACCRHIWHLMPDAVSLAAVETSERFADQLVSRTDLNAAVARLDPQAHRNVVSWRAAEAAWYTVADILQGDAAYHTASQTVETASESLGFSDDGSSARRLVGRIIQDIFGNPFHPVSIAAAWLIPTVASLAQAAYDNRNLPAGTLDNVRLAVLADALEDAGASGALLEHLRSEGPHVRGCFALDLVLGKE